MTKFIIIMKKLKRRLRQVSILYRRKQNQRKGKKGLLDASMVTETIKAIFKAILTKTFFLVIALLLSLGGILYQNLILNPSFTFIIEGKVVDFENPLQGLTGMPLFVNGTSIEEFSQKNGDFKIEVTVRKNDKFVNLSVGKFPYKLETKKIEIIPKGKNKQLHTNFNLQHLGGYYEAEEVVSTVTESLKKD
jgi:hypothetical protein